MRETRGGRCAQDVITLSAVASDESRPAFVRLGVIQSNGCNAERPVFFRCPRINETQRRRPRSLFRRRGRWVSFQQTASAGLGRRRLLGGLHSMDRRANAENRLQSPRAANSIKAVERRVGALRTGGWTFTVHAECFGHRLQCV